MHRNICQSSMRRKMTDTRFCSADSIFCQLLFDAEFQSLARFPASSSFRSFPRKISIARSSLSRMGSGAGRPALT
jgi:hypothetical protein